MFKRGYFRQVLDEGIPKTSEMLSNKHVGHVHITGSLTTDIAVRKTLAKSRPSLSETEIKTMVTSELGAVTPYIVAPGTYTDKELVHTARMIAFSKKNFGGCNCLNANAVVLAKEWDQKEHFRKVLLEELKRQPDVPAYYPGSRQRRADIQKRYEALGEKRAIIVGGADYAGVERTPEDSVLIAECGTPGEPGYDGYAVENEAFGPVLAIVELAGDCKSDDFVPKVVAPFVNDTSKIYGSLSCSLFLDASTISSQTKTEKNVASLHYGVVAVNCPTNAGFAVMFEGGVWGANFRDTSRQSGFGYVGNTYCIDHLDRSVVYGPPLSSAHMMDLAKQPPAVVLDAVHAVMCSSNIFYGLVALSKVLAIRMMGTLMSFIFPKDMVQKFKTKFGKALFPKES